MKILHASDFHLDSPFQRLNVQQALIRRRELRELPWRLIRLAKEKQVDLILLPGDLFDGQRVYPETVETLIAALGSVDIPVVIAPGNHDCADGRSPYLAAKWPENVHIFTAAELSEVVLPELNCVVHGYAFTTPHRTEEPLRGFSAPEDGMTHLLCAHGEVGLNGQYAPISPAALGSSGVSYAALGHVHGGTGLCREGNVVWAYCGCPEGRGFDECGEKGALLVTVENHTVSAEFCALCSRQYRVETVCISEFEQFLAQQSGRDLVRVILAGESDYTPDLTALTERAKSAFFYVELKDETTLPQDLWARAEEDNLTGLFLREMRKRLERASEEERSTVLLATRFGLAALEGGEDVCP